MDTFPTSEDNINRIITEREFLSGMNILLYNKNTIYNTVITIFIINIIIIIIQSATDHRDQGLKIDR